MPDSDPTPVLALVRDLLFASKITATAQASGSTVRIVRDPAKLEGVGGRRLLVDLNLEGAIEPAARWGADHCAEVVGFVSHVDASTTARAREAGISRVIARSRFVEILPELVK